MLKPGIYEQLINQEMDEALQQIPDNQKDVKDVDASEASKIISSYLSNLLEKEFERIGESDGKSGLEKQISLANQILSVIPKEETNAQMISEKGQQLFGVLSENDTALLSGKSAKDIARPETSIAFSNLFTGAVNEPQMLSEIKKEIVSASHIDMLVSFIKWSGLRQMIKELEEFTSKGGHLRVICTSYMGATDAKAIEVLNSLSNTEIKISYDTKRTRLHAKAYVFYRETGYTTAYIGSSNMSNAALTSGLEWNVKAAQNDMAATIQKVSSTFESYWHDPEFEVYDETQKERLIHALKEEKFVGSEEDRKYIFEIRPFSYQKEILDRLEAERNVRHSYKNLVVAATGCGKTVISAFDYLRFKKEHPGNHRLLFVAHREEILKQSIETYRGILKDPNFGDLFVGKYRPESIDHLFISIQTFNSQKLYEKLDPDYYDYIVVDEFHHATAPIYQNFLAYFTPKILLGLTATPERMDGEDILQYFDGRIAAEIRLPEAIDRKLLCPFQYFGVSDTVDLSEIRWTNGGYDKRELESLYVDNRKVAEKRAANIIENVQKYTSSIEKMKALGFCVSKAHAKFMTEMFNAYGISSIELDGDSKNEERVHAKEKLEKGEVKVIFVVDLYNEGVDIPSVDTIFFLRPTESLTIFLQQLGRGLRLFENKECLTVLDFIGQANKRYNYEEKFAALLANTNHSISYEVYNGFVNVPKGCYIQLEKKASEYILENIKTSIENRSGMIDRIRTFQEDTHKELNLINFVRYYHLDPRDIYKKDCFSRLCVTAGVKSQFEESLEETIKKALPGLASLDSKKLIEFLLKVMDQLDDIHFEQLMLNERRMLQMFYISIWMEAIDEQHLDAAMNNLHELSSCKNMCEEIKQLLQYRYDEIEFWNTELEDELDAPIDLHCTYSRDQLLIALDFMKPANVREGVKWLPERNLDVLFVTLNKSDKEYSPTTMYNDYSINDELFHWQSQSTTSDTSNTGQRYIHHQEQGSKVLLCVREAKKDQWKNASPYTVLGLVEYESHTSSKPMNITWKLENKIPAKFLKKTGKLLLH